MTGRPAENRLTRADTIALWHAVKALEELLKASRDLEGIYPEDLAEEETSLHVFISQAGSPLTESGFTTGWQRAMVEALETKVISRRFTFHDLRAYYTTQHKARYGALPELHASSATTARVYDRSKVSKRQSLG